jgi:hypothetical protein
MPLPKSGGGHLTKSFSTGTLKSPKGGIKVGFKILKSKRLDNLRKHYGKPFNAAIARAMNKEMTRILKKAKKDTPVDTGRLRDSGRLEKPRGKGRTVWQWEIKFGGVRRRATVRNDGRGNRLVDYARIVHAKGGRNGKANFLLDNWNIALRGLDAKMNREVRKSLPKEI